MKKRILASLLCFIMILGICPLDFTLPVSADASGTCGDNLTWSYDESTFTLTISGTGEMYEYTINSNGGQIKTNAPWNTLGIKTVTIVSGVTSIGSYAFYGLTGITSITIPDSVTSIGIFAFKYTAYYNNDSNWENGVLYINTHLIEAKIEKTGNYEITQGAKVISNYTFYRCTGLTSITIPESVTSIGDGAFYGCTGLTSITIPDSVTSIGFYVFSDCTELTSINVDSNNSVYHSAGNCLIETANKTLIAGCKNSVIPSDGSVTNIGRYAFSGRTGFTSITIPDSVTSIGDYAFNDCT
ncbi:MAG: leucine-rich repeat domain-containing protein, partial [Clostridia bacterium]|nr:leucine-rich repeat domain-containing protein [Clostridia bacterium]